MPKFYIALFDIVMTRKCLFPSSSLLACANLKNAL